jgi:hypothetical protein
MPLRSPDDSPTKAGVHSSATPEPADGSRPSPIWTGGLIAAIAAGIVFRLIWLRDIEFKMDEAGAMYLLREFWSSHDFPLIGIDSSTGLPNPGLNLWVLIAISAVLPTLGPLEMSRAIQFANVAAILGLTWFVLRGIDRAEREPWLWSVALVSVNPLAVLYSRKLWAQELFPLFVLPFLVGWFYRSRRWGAVIWGVAGALLGQVHLTGFLFAAPFAAVTFLWARRSVRWPAWFAGSVIGTLPLLPWLLHVLASAHESKPPELQNPAVPFGNWVNYVLALDLRRPLGDDFPSFAAFPQIGGAPSYGVTIALSINAILFLMIFVNRVRRSDTAQSGLWAALRGSETGLVLLAGFVGFCTLLAVMLHPAYYTYLIVAFVLPSLSIAWVALTGASLRQRTAPRRLLAGMVVAQAALTLAFLCFVHETQVIHGEYGTAYGSQGR